MADVLKRLTAGVTFFDGVHIFTPQSDVPDDGALRLVILIPDQFYTREEPRLAFDGATEYVRNHGTAPRYRGNRLIFVAPDHGALARLRDCIRVALAWKSIVEDVEEMRLTLDNLQAEQARKELKGADDVLPRVARECYKWLLCPSQDLPTGKPSTEVFPLNTSGSALGPEIERVCLDNELVIATWSPIHLRAKLKELYWKDDRPAVKAIDFWNDTHRYLYLPRLKDRGTIAHAIVKGAATTDFFGTAYGQTDGRYDGFKFGDANVQFDDTLILIEPGAAARYAAALKPAVPPGSPATLPNPPHPPSPGAAPALPNATGTTSSVAAKSKVFHGNVAVNASAAKLRLVQIADEVIAALASDPNADLKVTLEIQATFPNGAQEQTKRAVSENARTLGFKNADWE
jgi:hypothetical protein